MHKIYKAQITAFAPPAVVIVTAFRNSGGYYKAESFCVFPPPNPGHSFIELKFDHKSFQDSPVELSEDFMLEEALGQARIDIALHLEANYKGNDFLMPTGELRLDETGIEFLVHLHVKDSASFLWEIQNKTSCDDLRRVLEPVFNLPKISRRQI